MISISAHVQSWLDEHPTIRQHVSDGIINHSALARTLKSDIEDQLGERVSVESVTIALNRIGKSLKASASYTALQYVGDVSVQTGLTILIYDINDFDALELPDLATMRSGYFVSTRGIWHASIIATSLIAKDPRLSASASVCQDNVTSITIKLKEGHIPIPGVCAGILGVLANKGVNLQEVISTHNELTILCDHANAERAMSALMDIKDSRFD